MSDALATFAAALTALLALGGSAAALVGALGLLRMRSFYERVHPPTIGSTGGLGMVLAASIVHFSVHEGRLVVHELLIAAFMLVTTPITYIVILRAALTRGAGPAPEEPPA